MLKKDALWLLKHTDVMQEGHFRLTSGRHSDRYMQCAHLFEHPYHTETVCLDMAMFFDPEDFGKIDLVAGPALGGVIMAYEMARVLRARNIFTEREDGKMTLRRGFHVEPGTRALVVEDVVTTGGSVREVIELMRANGAEVVGVGSVVDRSDGEVDFGVPFYATLSTKIESWPADECPLCAQGLPIIKPGSRKA
ncbi:orotate phosphoribosyltransferase [Synergistales bacterium]|nr:orotate phosphoribosyltransferase [Synergistales bacterium]